MLILARNTENVILATLVERTTIAAPYYLFVLWGKSGQANIRIVLSDISENPTRYQKFQFTDGTDITLPNYGDYKYQFRQKETSTTTLADDDIILEEGIARVQRTTTVPQFARTRNTVVYDG